MKRLFAIIFSLLLLTACSKTEEAPVVTDEPEEVVITEEAVQETEPVEEEPTEEPVEVTEEETPAAYTVQSVEGLVEDTIGYTFEVPVFDYPGYPAMEQHYSHLVEQMEAFTKEVVHANAMERGCIASVYGYVTKAVVIDDVLAVTYVFECDYSDTEEPTIESRIDRFDINTGEAMEG